MNHRPFRELDPDITPERRRQIDAIKARMREEERRAATPRPAAALDFHETPSDPRPNQLAGIKG